MSDRPRPATIRMAASLLLAASLGGAATAGPRAASEVVAQSAPAVPVPVAAMRDAIKYVVVIYQENWSFDGLYGSFPGANGLSAAPPSSYAQVDKISGAPLTALPQPLIGSGRPDPNFPAGLPVRPYSAMPYVPPNALTGDLVHRYWEERSQIDGGKMDKFVTWSDNGGLVLSSFDATPMPEGRLAARYTLSDNTFHSAFGSSFLNHQWLICACTPVFPDAPPAVVAQVDPVTHELALDANGKIIHNGFVTPDGFAVNTVFSVNAPHPANVPAANLLPNQTNPTIGDRLTGANVTWKWYSGGWTDALNGNPDPLFQYHHQPFAYFANYADGTRAKADHLQDETQFLADLRGGTLPSVSFIKPLGPDNEHPGYASLLRGQQHVADLVEAVQNSAYWKNTAVIITYDENGGRWDHVSPPPPKDVWGPGTRVPLIVVSPFAKRGFVDHTQYETVSILAFIEKIWNVQPLTARDAAANPLSGAFDFTQSVPG